ncbi:MAG: IPT/TIG domain-containing protein, partial [Gammaproteobacteria bacterium]|nr:IPT/TIG domain-containing protein [Gammaproteobacteria bacterium]
SKRNRFIFDITKPTLPQIGHSRAAGIKPAVLQDGFSVAGPIKGSEYAMFDVRRPRHVRELGRFDSFGFRLPGSFVGVDGLTTLAGNTTTRGCGKKSAEGFLSIFDTSRPQIITLLDALKVQSCARERSIRSPLFTDDGLVLTTVVGTAELSRKSELLFVDTLTLDLASSIPANNAVAVPTGTVIELLLTHPVEIPDGETELAHLSRFLALLLEDGTPEGVPAGFTPSLDPAEPSRVFMTPTGGLSANRDYRIEISGVLASRRTAGLFDHTIRFSTASDNAPAPRILDVSPRVVLTNGGSLQVTVADAVTPAFLLSGVAASIDSNASNPDQGIYVLEVPPSLSGPAELQVVNANGASDELIGAVQYVEPLELVSASPRQGSVNGGTKVTLKGVGFKPGTARLTVRFARIPALDNQVKVLDSQTIEVITPPGRIGRADITVELDNGQTSTLPDAFEYQQPIQSNFDVSGRIYDAKLDPTGTFMIAAAGKAGVAIYNINASTFTGDENNPLNPDDLRRTIDLNGDDIDDRIETEILLPDGHAALGIDTFFERATDRVFVTGAKLDNSGNPIAGSARLFIIAFDEIDIRSSTVVADLPLPANFARGIEVENGQAAMAMGDAGIGLADVFLHTKAYLASRFALPDGHEALDLTRLAVEPGRASRYAVTSGDYHIGTNRLNNALDTETGAFYITEFDSQEGWRVVGSVDVPASRVVVEGDYAYLASGEGGLVIVDISEHTNPRIVARVVEAG